MLWNALGPIKIFQGSQKGKATAVDLGHQTYWGVLGLTFLGPFFLGFHHSLNFNKRWREILSALLLILTIYIPWDMWFTQMGVWSFNPKYVSGQYVFNIPIEEFLFFIATPFSCLFVLECVRYYFPSLSYANGKKHLHNVSRVIMFLFAMLAFILIVKNPVGWYTLSATITGSIGLFYLYNKRKKDFLQILITWLVLLIPFYVCNGILTGIHFWEYPFFNDSQIQIDDAVVLYNNLENSSLRIWSVPVEDFFYGFGFYAIGVSLYRRKEK